MKGYLLYYTSPFHLPGMQLQLLEGQKPFCDHEGRSPLVKLEIEQKSRRILSTWWLALNCSAPEFISLFLENFIEWDLWSNIFKFLSNIWFCASPHVWAGFWQYFGRGWEQDKTKYALSPTCFGCQASDVLGQSGPFSLWLASHGDTGTGHNFPFTASLCTPRKVLSDTPSHQTLQTMAH